VANEIGGPIMSLEGKKEVSYENIKKQKRENENYLESVKILNKPSETKYTKTNRNFKYIH
jgi:hypothetical protein